MGLETIQSLWIGNKLSVMEQLCIRSFLDRGHPFRLYAYQDIAGIPEGAELRDAREILPEREIFVYQTGSGRGSPSAFSNMFRYKMLLENGGWWADLDAYCLKPLRFSSEHVIGYERERDGSLHVNCGLMRVPAGSKFARFCWDECQRVDRGTVRWGQIGPRLTARAISETGTQFTILPPEAFYPIDHFRSINLVRESIIPENCYSIHLWNSNWRREGLDPDATYRSDCIYEKLKQWHGITTTDSVNRLQSTLSLMAPKFLRKMACGMRHRWATISHVT
jgi:hypothetical protein